MILLVIFLLIVGMFIETLSATIIVAPILMPVAAQYGIDPIQFAMVMVITLVVCGRDSSRGWRAVYHHGHCEGEDQGNPALFARIFGGCLYQPAAADLLPQNLAVLAPSAFLIKRLHQWSKRSIPVGFPLGSIFCP